MFELVYAILLFALTYVLMLVFSKYRPQIAIGSAVIFIVTGMLPLNQIVEAIDFNVLMMIAGTMGLVKLFIDSKMPALLADLIMEKVPNVQMAAVALALVWCVTRSPNRALRWRTADSMPQRRFARQINGASLLNYGTLDGGFYTAAGVLPPCRYFCVTNMPLDDQWAEQNALLAEGGVDYVVALTGDLGTAFPRYAVVDQCSCDGGEGLLTWYLYKRQA